MKKYLMTILAMFLISSQAFALELTTAVATVNSNTKYNVGDIVFINHRVNNSAAHLKEVKFINIYHSYDKSALEFVGIMSTQAAEYCSYKATDYMTCSVVSGNIFATDAVFATVLYKVKKPLSIGQTITYSYQSNVINQKSNRVYVMVKAPAPVAPAAPVAPVAPAPAPVVPKEEEKVPVTEEKAPSGAVTISAKSPVSINVGDVYLLEIGIAPTVSYDKLNFSSSNESVATVDRNGYVTARKAGRTVVRIDYARVSKEVVVTVNEGPKVIEKKPSKDSSTFVIVTLGFILLVIVLLLGIGYLFRARRNLRDDIYIGE